MYYRNYPNQQSVDSFFDNKYCKGFQLKDTGLLFTNAQKTEYQDFVSYYLNSNDYYTSTPAKEKYYFIYKTKNKVYYTTCKKWNENELYYYNIADISTAGLMQDSSFYIGVQPIWLDWQNQIELHKTLWSYLYKNYANYCTYYFKNNQLFVDISIAKRSSIRKKYKVIYTFQLQNNQYIPKQ